MTTCKRHLPEGFMTTIAEHWFGFPFRYCKAVFSSLAWNVYGFIKVRSVGRKQKSRSLTVEETGSYISMSTQFCMTMPSHTLQ